MTPFTFHPIGVVKSPYKEKFAVPRQPGLIEDGRGELQLFSPYNQPEAVRGLKEFSHLWVLFVFHRNMQEGWRPTVRPPRLGGNSRMGVFATRSPFRPNPIGMSLVELIDIHYSGSNVALQLGSVDLVDGTPVLDIKPYLPYVESQPDALAGFASQAPQTDISVSFSSEAQECLQQQQETYPHLARFITQLLAQDPRPAYHKLSEQKAAQEYAAHLLEFNVRWRIWQQRCEVFAIEPVQSLLDTPGHW